MLADGCSVAWGGGRFRRVDLTGGLRGGKGYVVCSIERFASQEVAYVRRGPFHACKPIMEPLPAPYPTPKSNGALQAHLLGPKLAGILHQAPLSALQAKPASPAASTVLQYLVLGQEAYSRPSMDCYSC